MARGKKRSREAEPIALPDSPSDLAAFAAGDDYFSSGAQKLKKAADNSALVNLASQHAAGYRELVDEVCPTEHTTGARRFFQLKASLQTTCLAGCRYLGRAIFWKVQILGTAAKVRCHFEKCSTDAISCSDARETLSGSCL